MSETTLFVNRGDINAAHNIKLPPLIPLYSKKIKAPLSILITPYSDYFYIRETHQRGEKGRQVRS